MKIVTLLLAALVLISLGFTLTEKRENADDHEELKQHFKASASTINPYNQSRKDIATFD